MDTVLKKKIIKDLEKSGFGSEMRAIREFHKRDWNCIGNYCYFDKDFEITREGDLHASRRLMRIIDIPTAAVCWFHITGEVKKSESPWIVFKEDLSSKSYLSLQDSWQNLTHTKRLPCNASDLTEYMTKHSLLTNLRWAGYGVHESFKKPDKQSRWYNSFVSACKAAEHVLSSETLWMIDEEEITSDVHANPPYLLFVMPVVILDGPLLSAEISGTGDIDINEIAAAPFEFKFRTVKYDRDSYRVDLISLSSLNKYIEICEKRQDDIFQALLEKAGLKP